MREEITDWFADPTANQWETADIYRKRIFLLLFSLFLGDSEREEERGRGEQSEMKETLTFVLFLSSIDFD